MPAEALIDRAVVDIADGNSVDWDLLDSQARDEQERKQLKWLRVLEEIANLHRSTLDSAAGDDDDASQSAASSEASADGSVDTSGVAALAAAAAGARERTAASAASVQTWGRFQLREKVGEGSFGAVYRAWDPQLERELAIKILHRHLTDDRLRDRLLREGRALAKIRQANVVSVFAVEAADERVGLCMEFVRGQTLEDVLRTQGTLSARETVLVGEDVCRALAAVHNAGFVHRDVKARNVMREQAGRIVLMDFGTGREARALEEAKRPDVAGTPLYMAPEVLAGEPASARSDVYSVGVLLYHLVTAAYPVTARSIDELRDAHREGRRRFLSECRPDLPMAFVRVVERSLAADPDERYQNAGALLNALGLVLGERESAATGLRAYVAPTVVASALAVCAPLVLGMLNSAAFNVTLGRAGFSQESLFDWWVWGARATVLPMFLLLVAATLIALGVGFRRLVLRFSSALTSLDFRLRQRLGTWAHRVHLDDPWVLSALVLVCSSAALLNAWWSFRELLAALITRVADGSSQQLALLSPAFESQHDWYRESFSYLVILMVMAWYGVLKLSRAKREPVNRGILAAGAAVLALTIGLLDFPYRLLVHNKFDVATWSGGKCSIIGQRASLEGGTELKLMCAGLQPRHQTVAESNTRLQRSTVQESVYTSFSTAGGGSGPSVSDTR